MNISFPKQSKYTTARKSGFTLIEVVLALAILAGALAIIGQITSSGTRDAITARDLSVAQIHCASVMSEIVAGSLPAESNSGSSIEESEESGADSIWQYEVEVGDTDLEGLLSVKVTVRKDESAAASSVEFSLTRMVIDPDYEPPNNASQ